MMVGILCLVDRMHLLKRRERFKLDVEVILTDPFPEDFVSFTLLVCKLFQCGCNTKLDLFQISLIFI